MNYLLDTNVCIALINLSSSKVRLRFAQAAKGKASISTSCIVVHELWYGVAKSHLFAQNARAFEVFFSRDIAVLDYSAKDAQAAAEIRADLERRRKRIGRYDTLIAGQALARNLILVTANTREFGRVKGLTVEDWTV